MHRQLASQERPHLLVVAPAPIAQACRKEVTKSPTGARPPWTPRASICQLTVRRVLEAGATGITKLAYPTATYQSFHVEGLSRVSGGWVTRGRG